MDPSDAVHPLVAALLRTIDAAERVLVFGAGSGRHLPPLLARGAHCDAVEADPGRRATLAREYGARVHVAADLDGLAGRYAAILTTHALLHGTRGEVATALDRLASRLAPGGALFATFGSTRDPRFAAGSPAGEGASAPRDGSEAGVVHAYFDRATLDRLLAGFATSVVTETSAATTAGAWTHTRDEARDLVHWFVEARRADDDGGDVSRGSACSAPGA